MSITSLSISGSSTGRSIHFPIYHVAITNNTNATLRFVFDVYVGTTLIYRAKVYPTPGANKVGFFDATPIIRAYVKKYFTPNPTASAFVSWTTDDLFLDYTVKVGEEWYAGTTFNFSYAQQTSTVRGWNCYPEFLQGGTLQVMPGTTAGAILTDRDMSQLYFAPSYSFLFPYWRAAAPGSTNTNFSLTTYTEAGVYQTNMLLTMATANVKQLTQLRISKDILNAYSAGSFVATTGKVGFAITDGITTAQQGTLNAWCNPKHDPMVVTFLNRYGAYESFVFGLVNKKEVEVSRETYAPSEFQKIASNGLTAVILGNTVTIMPPTGSAVNLDSNNVYYPQQVVSSARHALSFKLTSDYVTEKNYNWLKQLIASPEVYIEQKGPDNKMYFYPVVIADKQWQEKKATSDKMFNLELTLISFDNIYSQFQ